MNTMTHPYLATVLLMMSAQMAHAERLVDPTRPAHAKGAGTSTSQALRLEAILISNGARVAIVNGKLVRDGDHIGAARIDAILPDGIRYTLAGRSLTAQLRTRSTALRENITSNEDAS